MKIYRRLTFLSILIVGMMFVIGSGEEETVDSDIINTHGIVADIDILATSNSTQIYADLTAKDMTTINKEGYIIVRKPIIYNNIVALLNKNL